jgi:hypothetical protein
VSRPPRVPAPAPGDHRQRTIDALCAHFAADRLEVGEFERRLDVAHRARAAGELDALLQDLPGGPVAASSVPAPRPVALARDIRPRDLIVAVMGETSRRGRWTPARSSFVYTLMGGSTLDFREALLGPGTTEIHVMTVMGGVEIVVPPQLALDISGIGIMGGFAHAASAPPATGDDERLPLLRVRGVAFMGGVEIVVAEPGQDLRQARKRRRRK